MDKRAPKWQEMMRTSLELKLVSVSPPTRGRSLPVLFASETGKSGWLERAERILAATRSRKTKGRVSLAKPSKRS